MAAAISFREAVSVAGHFPLLAGVTLEVAEGEVVHLRGPNGAGKTSLLLACCGLLPISSGDAMVLGHDLRFDRMAIRREVGLFGHALFLYDELSAEENLRFALRASRGEPGRALPALDRLGLSGRLRRTPLGRLSNGQQRRVAIALLVARAPRLWLLDEPHAGLDERARSVVDEIIAEQREIGTTVVLVSHELDRARGIADRVLTLAGGRIHDRPVPLESAFGETRLERSELGREADLGVA